MYETNETITMKKMHPCGGKEWLIVRAGADLKLRCLTCGRIVTMTRDEARKRAKVFPTEKGTKGEP